MGNSIKSTKLSRILLGRLAGLLTGVSSVHGVVLLHLHGLHLLLDGLHVKASKSECRLYIIEVFQPIIEVCTYAS